MKIFLKKVNIIKGLNEELEDAVNKRATKSVYDYFSKGE